MVSDEVVVGGSVQDRVAGPELDVRFRADVRVRVADGGKPIRVMYRSTCPQIVGDVLPTSRCVNVLVPPEIASASRNRPRFQGAGEPVPCAATASRRSYPTKAAMTPRSVNVRGSRATLHLEFPRLVDLRSEFSSRWPADWRSRDALSLFARWERPREVGSPWGVPPMKVKPI